MDPDFPYITRQDIINFPFPYKLWLVVHLDYCEFLRWNRDGTVILLDLVALEDYLNSARSIFKIKNNSSFLQHLVQFKFERLNAKPEAEEDLLLQYKNENFQRHRLDLLAKIRRHTYQCLGDLQTNKYEESVAINDGNQTTSIPKRVSDRMLGDLCFMFHGGLSNIQKSRLRFHTILHFINEKRILREKIKASELVQNSSKIKADVSFRSAAANSTSFEGDQVIELPVELFENPHDSVLYLGDDFRPEYAGYYGNCGKDQIIHFFGEYLPMYEDGSMEVKKIVTDNFNNNLNQSLPSNTESTINNPRNAIDKPNILISTPITQFKHLNASSNLEPIYASTTENSENIDINTNNFTVTHLSSNSFDDEADISMEEFIKFKDSPSENISVNSTQIDFTCADHDVTSSQQEETTTFPQMPTSVQMEITGDVKENEASFRNFFSQYRASLNLLYENH